MFLDPDLTEYIHLKSVQGDHHTVEAILRESPHEVHATNGRLAAPPLFFASRHGHFRVCEVLLAHEADVRFHVKGWSALHEAAFGNHEEVVRLLLKHGADPDRRVVYSGTTPLMQAAKAGLHAVCDVLLKAGADPWLRDIDGKLAVDLASANRCQEVIERSMKHELLKEQRQHCQTIPSRCFFISRVVCDLPDELFHHVLGYV